MIQFDEHIFQRGWNHQLENLSCTDLKKKKEVVWGLGFLEAPHNLNSQLQGAFFKGFLHVLMVMQRYRQ